MDDVLVIGGGVMGCASALALAKRGLSVRVLDKGEIGAEASGAAAGILGAQLEAHGPGAFVGLSVASRGRYPALSAALREATGIDVGFRPGGILRACLTAEQLSAEIDGAAWQRAEGLRVDVLAPDAARALEPSLSPELSGALFFPDDARIDPPALLQGLRVAAERAGARFEVGAHARAVRCEGGRATGVHLVDGRALSCGQLVLAAGAWSTLIEGVGLPHQVVRPVRGQMVELACGAPLLSRVVFGPGAYVSPRDDGRVVIGSTVEHVGFRPGVTAGAVRDLLVAALRVVPALVDASVRRTWSGFRPYTEDHLPLLGRASVEGVVIATGHFRNGILLAPATADLVTSLILGEAPPADLAPFLAALSPSRVAPLARAS